ncbi:helix-turn-helix domain-containing protein [Klebsiella pneumoniae]|uniref:helix-turn-helix domain-containing protein n=1 Tax=Klebsiella pneumoniae TaxID=573 RepID=UPI000E2C2931|nr:transcriptional regulator TetR family [Klebsiella pneumoniae]
MSRIDRKDQIIAAALELFRSKGFADVSTRDLAEHAGLSRSHVYHYFSDWKTDRKFNRMRPSMARVLGLETRSAKEG